MTEAPKPTGLDHPAAGLVLVVVALAALPQGLQLVATVLFDTDAWSARLAIMLLPIVAVAIVQLAAGLAIAWQSPARHQWFAAYAAICVATLLVAAVWWPDELGKRQVAVLAFDVLGTPLIVLLGPRLFSLAPAPALAGLLILGGASALIHNLLFSIEQARWMVRGDVSLGGWFGTALRLVIELAMAALAIHAGRKLSRGEPARRALGMYVIFAVASIAILDLLTIITVVVDGDRDVMWRMIVPSIVIGAGVSIARLLIMWRYAQRELAAPAPGGAALPWLALWFVPQLLARLLLYEELGQLGGLARTLGLVLCVALAIAIVLALKTRVWSPAVAVAGALLALGIYTSQTVFNRLGALDSAIVGPLAMLFTAVATAAWFSRRLSSQQ